MARTVQEQTVCGKNFRIYILVFAIFQGHSWFINSFLFLTVLTLTNTSIHILTLTYTHKDYSHIIRYGLFVRWFLLCFFSLFNVCTCVCISGLWRFIMAGTINKNSMYIHVYNVFFNKNQQYEQSHLKHYKW